MTTAWPKVRLGNVLVEARPGFASGHDLEKGVFQFRMNNLTRDGHFDLSKRRRVPRNTKKIESFLLRSGDVLFNATNSPELVGKSAYIGDLDEPAVFSNHFLRIRVDTHRLAPRFLWRWLQLQWQRGLFRSRARQWVNQAAFTREALVELQIPLPPIEEQRRIAAVLDQADEVRARRGRSLALIDSLNESIFLDTFGDPAGGAHPFDERPLAQIVADGTPVTYGIVQAGEEYHGGVPYIRTGDIVDGHIAASRLRHTDPALAAKFSRSTVRAGDLVMSIRATVGTTAMVPPELEGANLTQGTARIAAGPDIEPLYLLAFLRTAASQRWIERQAKGATFREITLNRLRELPVMVPPMALQAEFTAAAKQRLAIESTATASAAHLESLFASLQYRAFAGQL